MAQQTLNNAESGLIIRGKINDNFTELYAGIINATTLAALTAASALDGAELYYSAQAGNARKVTGSQIKTWCSASPTLVTPVLGVAAATSLALADGSASAPALRGADADSGIFFAGNNTRFTLDGSLEAAVAGGGISWRLKGAIGFATAGQDASGTMTTSLSSVGSGIIGVGTGAAGSVAGSVQAALFSSGSAILVTTRTALTNNAAAQLATITNGPAAGNPTKWIPIDDNGTIRNIPAW